MDDVGDAFGGAEEALGFVSVEVVVEEGFALVEELAEGVGAFTAEEGVGVVAGGHLEDADGEAMGEEDGEGAVGGFLAGGVGVEAEDDAGGEAAEEGGLMGCEGGALGGGDVVEAVFVGGDEVELAFAEDALVGVGDGFFG